MEKVRLRHQQAEKLIATAKEQAIIREQQLQTLRAKGQSLPPESSLLGCWQVIEKTIICNFAPSKYWDFKLGDYCTIFRALSPEKYLFGESISSGESYMTPAQAIVLLPFTMTFEVTGRIIQNNFVKYRELPLQGKLYEGTDSSGRLIRMRQLPRLLEAHWQGW